jgi:hypothetical protein
MLGLERTLGYIVLIRLRLSAKFWQLSLSQIQEDMWPARIRTPERPIIDLDRNMRETREQSACQIVLETWKSGGGPRGTRNDFVAQNGFKIRKGSNHMSFERLSHLRNIVDGSSHSE